jgi:hypothetical protein
MTFALGDVVSIYAPAVGYTKYHLCLGYNDTGICCFLYLNSWSGYQADLSFDCARFPMIDPSTTGKTIVSLSLIVRYTARQLELYKAKKLGEIDKTVAAEIHTFSKTVKALSRPDKAFVNERLKKASEDMAAPAKAAPVK